MPESEQLDIDDLYKAADELQAALPITPKQIKAIHTIVNKLGWTDYRYRKLLTALFEVTSCKELTEQQTSILVETLNKLKG